VLRGGREALRRCSTHPKSLTAPCSGMVVLRSSERRKVGWKSRERMRKPNVRLAGAAAAAPPCAAAAEARQQGATHAAVSSRAHAATAARLAVVLGMVGMAPLHAEAGEGGEAWGRSGRWRRPQAAAAWGPGVSCSLRRERGGTIIHPSHSLSILGAL
jgi:hypothetical protein